MGSSRQESWGGLLWPPPGHLPNPGIEPASLRSPALTGGFFTTSFTGEALCSYNLAGIDRSYFIQPWEFLSEMFLLTRYIKGVYKSLFSIRPVTSPKRTDGYCFFFSIHNIPLYGYNGVYSSCVLHGRLGCLLSCYKQCSSKQPYTSVASCAWEAAWWSKWQSGVSVTEDGNRVMLLGSGGEKPPHAPALSIWKAVVSLGFGVKYAMRCFYFCQSNK